MNTSNAVITFENVATLNTSITTQISYSNPIYLYIPPPTTCTLDLNNPSCTIQLRPTAAVPSTGVTVSITANYTYNSQKYSQNSEPFLLMPSSTPYGPWTNTDTSVNSNTTNLYAFSADDPQFMTYDGSNIYGYQYGAWSSLPGVSGTVNTVRLNVPALSAKNLTFATSDNYVYQYTNGIALVYAINNGLMQISDQLPNPIAATYSGLYQTAESEIYAVFATQESQLYQSAVNVESSSLTTISAASFKPFQPICNHAPGAISYITSSFYTNVGWEGDAILYIAESNSNLVLQCDISESAPNTWSPIITLPSGSIINEIAFYGTAEDNYIDILTSTNSIWQYDLNANILSQLSTGTINSSAIITVFFNEASLSSAPHIIATTADGNVYAYSSSTPSFTSLGIPESGKPVISIATDNNDSMFSVNIYAATQDNKIWVLSYNQF